MKFYPYRKRAAKVLAMLNGGGGGGEGTKGFEVVLRWEFLAILQWGACKMFPPFKTRDVKSFTLSPP